MTLFQKINPEAYSGRGAMGAKPPLDQLNLLISGGFHAPTDAEPPWKEKSVSPLDPNS